MRNISTISCAAAHPSRWRRRRPRPAPTPPPPPRRPSSAGGGARPAGAPPGAPRTGPASQLAARTPANEPAAAGGAPVAQVTFPDNSSRLTPADRRIVGEVVPLQRQTGGAFRVVAYAPARRRARAARRPPRLPSALRPAP